jgi:hypothetical protein
MASVPRAKVYSSELVRAFKLDYYYHELNAYPPFTAALELLALACRSVPRAWYTTQMLREFCRQWRLPTEHGMDDLRLSLWNASHGDALRLTVGGRGWMEPELLRADPFVLSPPAYDPASPTDSHRRIAEWERQGIAAVKAAARAHQQQARENRQRLLAAGFRSMPPRHRNPNELHRLARRLFRCAVLNMSLSQIAEEENTEWPGGEAARPGDISAISQSITTWASELTIPLPDRRLRGKGSVLADQDMRSQNA